MEGYLVLVGGGVMGRAIVEAGLRAGVLRASRVVVAEPDAPRREAFRALGCRVAPRAGEALGVPPAEAPVTVVLAVKPQMFDGAASDIAAGLRAWGGGGGPGPLVVSIMAGVRASTIRAGLGEQVRVVRAMPNTPARVGQGVTGVAAGAGVTEADMALASGLFAALGPVVERVDESLMDAFTAVAGSGPAYLFYLAEAMERAAVQCGLDAGAARRVVGQTLRGAAALLDGTEPAALRAAVTSKGGTTAAAVGVLESEHVGDALVRAIIAARDRGQDLARGR